MFLECCPDVAGAFEGGVAARASGGRPAACVWHPGRARGVSRLRGAQGDAFIKCNAMHQCVQMQCTCKCVLLRMFDSKRGTLLCLLLFQ